MRGATSWQLLASKKQCNYVRHSCYIIVPLAAIVEVQKLRFPTVSGGQLHGDGCVHEIQVNAVLERVCLYALKKFDLVLYGARFQPARMESTYEIRHSFGKNPRQNVLPEKHARPTRRGVGLFRFVLF